MAHRLAVFGLLLAGCSATPVHPAPSRPTSRPSAAAKPGLIASCQSACEHRSQARAVAAQVITQECAEACASVPAWPVVDSGVSARRQLGRQVRLQGIYRGAHLELSDGVQVLLRGAEQLGLSLGDEVLLAGDLDSDAQQGLVLSTHFGAGPS